MSAGLAAANNGDGTVEVHEGAEKKVDEAENIKYQAHWNQISSSSVHETLLHDSDRLISCRKKKKTGSLLLVRCNVIAFKYFPPNPDFLRLHKHMAGSPRGQ